MDTYSHVIYQVKPRLELLDRLHTASLDVRRVLTNLPGYFIQELDDPTWLEADRLLKMKIVFLNSLQNSSYPFQEKEDFAALFGSMEISAAAFDRWWIVERHQARQELSYLEGMLGYGSEPIATESERVNQWLADQRDRINKPVFHESVLFHSPGELQISALVRGWWERPILELLASSEAAGFSNMVDDACSGFLAWCFAKKTSREGVFVGNVRSPSSEAGNDPYEWYDNVLSIVGGWKHPPYLVNLDECEITYRDEVVWPPEKRGRERPKDPRSMRAGSPFLWGWYGQDLGDLRPGKNTYNCYAFETLPQVPAPIDGSFRFLHSGRVSDRVIGPAKEIEANLASLIASKPPGLPTEFITFFKSPTLWRKIRSCTDCCFHIDPGFTPIPGGLGYLIRFLRDSQDCVKWHLHISPCATKHSVVATYHFSGSEHGGRPHARDITACASSFEEFIYRFWIENELWYSLNCQQPMPDGGEAYLNHYRQK